MPRVRQLTPALRQKEEESKSNEVLARALRRHKADTKVHDYQLAEKLGVGVASIYRWKEDPSKMTLTMARRIAHECRMSPEEWLAVGGYKA